MEDKRLVRYFATQDCSDLFRNIATGTVWARNFLDEKNVRWTTVSKWSGGYEPSCHIKEGMHITVVSPDGTPLFTEVIKKECGVFGTFAEKRFPFSWEAVRQCEKRFMEQRGLKSYEEWSKWLCRDMPSDIDRDNWRHYYVERTRKTKVDEFYIYGGKCPLVEFKEVHTKTNKCWTSYYLYDAKGINTLGIAGFKWKEI